MEFAIDKQTYERLIRENNILRNNNNNKTLNDMYMNEPIYMNGPIHTQTWNENPRYMPERDSICIHEQDPLYMHDVYNDKESMGRYDWRQYHKLRHGHVYDNSEYYWNRKNEKHEFENQRKMERQCKMEIERKQPAPVHNFTDSQTLYETW